MTRLSCVKLSGCWVNTRLILAWQNTGGICKLPVFAISITFLHFSNWNSNLVISLGECLKKLTGFTFLIVDDEKDNITVLEKLLTFYGATAHMAVDGLDALEKLKTIPAPDLIISDISMPNMDGWQLLIMLKEQYPEIPVIALTAHAMTGDKERILKAGFLDYISKPIFIADFASKIATLAQIAIDKNKKGTAHE